MAGSSKVRMECPWCGPFYRQLSDIHGICPKCKLTAGEHAYIERILADSTAVLRQEYAEYRAKRAKGQ